MPAAALSELALGDTALTALIGDRFAPGSLPQGSTLPAVTWRTARDEHYEGGSLYSGVYVFGCWAVDFTSAAAVRDALRGVLQHASGTYAGMVIDGIAQVDAADETVIIEAGRDTGRECATVTFKIWYERG